MTLSCEAYLDKVKEIKRNLTNLANPADFAQFSFTMLKMIFGTGLGFMRFLFNRPPIGYTSMTIDKRLI